MENFADQNMLYTMLQAPAPATIFCSEWTGLAPDLAARCEHQCVCEKFMCFESVDSGRRYLACA